MHDVKSWVCRILVESGIIDRMFKFLVSVRLSGNPDWHGISYGIDDETDVHIVVEKWLGNIHRFGAREESLRRPVEKVMNNEQI